MKLFTITILGLASILAAPAMATGLTAPSAATPASETASESETRNLKFGPPPVVGEVFRVRPLIKDIFIRSAGGRESMFKLTTRTTVTLPAAAAGSGAMSGLSVFGIRVGDQCAVIAHTEGTGPSEVQVTDSVTCTKGK